MARQTPEIIGFCRHTLRMAWMAMLLCCGRMCAKYGRDDQEDYRDERDCQAKPAHLLTRKRAADLSLNQETCLAGRCQSSSGWPLEEKG